MVYCCCVADALSNIAIWVDVSEDLFELTLLDLREETEPRLPRFPLLLPVPPALPRFPLLGLRFIVPRLCPAIGLAEGLLLFPEL